MCGIPLTPPMWHSVSVSSQETPISKSSRPTKLCCIHVCSYPKFQHDLLMSLDHGRKVICPSETERYWPSVNSPSCAMRIHTQGSLSMTSWFSPARTMSQVSSQDSLSHKVENLDALDFPEGPVHRKSFPCWMVTFTVAVESTMCLAIVGPESHFTVQKSAQASFNTAAVPVSAFSIQSCFRSCQVLLEDMDLPVEIVTRSSSSGHPRPSASKVFCRSSRRNVAAPERVVLRTPHWAKCKHSVPPLKIPVALSADFATKSGSVRIRASSRKDT